MSVLFPYVWFGLVVVLTVVMRAHRDGRWPAPRGHVEIIWDVYILTLGVLVWPFVLAAFLLGWI